MTTQPLTNHHDAHLFPEKEFVERLIDEVKLTDQEQQSIKKDATLLAEALRRNDQAKGGVLAFIRHYNLSTQEGIVLMSLAESLLRVPDKATKALLISEKLSSASWTKRIEDSCSTSVSVVSRCLSASKAVLETPKQSSFLNAWKGMVKRLGEPVIKKAVSAAIAKMSEHFVLGRDIDEALSNAKNRLKEGLHFSYDMLGEAAITRDDAKMYFDKYKEAILTLGKYAEKNPQHIDQLGVSVKLSALHPRYDIRQRADAVSSLSEQLLELAILAKQYGLHLTVDAEEAARLDMSLEIISYVFSHDSLKGTWNRFGLAVQAYQKRALAVLHELNALSDKVGRSIEVRLVKGAYWDSEIKWAQMAGEPEYPVFTQQAHTDLNYLACVNFMIKHSHNLHGKFATHNAYTAAYVAFAVKRSGKKRMRFQMLQGMGDSLMAALKEKNDSSICLGLYAPVGEHEALLPYLVRRLLENGANSSFLNQIYDHKVPVSEITRSPFERMHNDIQLPRPDAILQPLRHNSAGICLSNPPSLEQLLQTLDQWRDHQWEPKEIAEGAEPKDVYSPSNPADRVGSYIPLDAGNMSEIICKAETAHLSWEKVSLEERSCILDTLGNLLESNREELYSLLAREAGKNLDDAIAEIREAIDFCYYYAAMARITLAPQALQSYTGESNVLHMVGRGVMLCISPWNFPAAIFLGQVVACLVAGNTVLAKPAEPTTLIARRLVELAHEAGIPKDALQLLPLSGRIIGEKCLPDNRISGVVFTGSTEVAKRINITLAERDGPIAPFIAETGGINAMIVDSTALPEQLVPDVIVSAFGSAGQRCSALRILCLPEETADTVMTMLKGAMDELHVGDPNSFQTDVGPCINTSAQTEIQQYIESMKANHVYHTVSGPTEGSFVSPHVFEVDSVSSVKREIFGPVLHVVRYAKGEMENTIKTINDLGFGLTFGLHTRLNTRMKAVSEAVHAGNIYINRNMTGAIVGVQPFGGMGLSGTGPKAGGPNYLLRLCHEKTITNNTAAIGGDIDLIVQASTQGD